MTQKNEQVQIETDLFIFELPEGWKIETLGEEAELISVNDDFLVVSTYTLDKDTSNDPNKQLKSIISTAMSEAANDSELSITRPLKSDKTADNLIILSLLTQTNSKTNEYFDQYAIINESTAVLISVEGNLKFRSSSALVEESAYDIYFK
jgi:hypothetical protein